MRRVVVTGLGAVSPLAVGARPTWKRILSGESGISSVLTDRGPASQWKGIPSTVAGLVPRDQGNGAEHAWTPSTWLSAAEQDKLPIHTQYALAASDMALKDAEWNPSTAEEREASGVSMGSGIGDLDHLYSTSLNYEEDASF